MQKTGGRGKVRDALTMVHEYTAQKSREAVKNWPAYLLTLLKKFEPDLAAEGRTGKKGGKSSTKAESREAPSGPSKEPPKEVPKKPLPEKKAAAEKPPEVVEAPVEEEPFASEDEPSR